LAYTQHLLGNKVDLHSESEEDDTEESRFVGEHDENDDEEEAQSEGDSTPERTHVDVLLGNRSKTPSSRPLSAPPVVKTSQHRADDDSVTGILNSSYAMLF
jgi:hypothetical protein